MLQLLAVPYFVEVLIVVSHLQREIERLKHEILTLSAIVEEQLFQAMQAIVDRDEALAERIIRRDTEIDRLEVEVEEECLKCLALYQPVANDLRYIVAILKINNDLERIGDIATNIASRALDLVKFPDIEIPTVLSAMADKTKAMLGKSLEALIHLNGGYAQEVRRSDTEVDIMHREMYSIIERSIIDAPTKTKAFIMLLSVSRGLERISDLTTNIAEDVIYTIEGNIVRHKHDDHRG